MDWTLPHYVITIKVGINMNPLVKRCLNRECPEFEKVNTEAMLKCYCGWDFDYRNEVQVKKDEALIKSELKRLQTLRGKSK